MVGAGRRRGAARAAAGVAPGARVVDLCAAPGGKSAQLAAAGAKVTAVDRSAERLKRLAANFEPAAPRSRDRRRQRARPSTRRRSTRRWSTRLARRPARSAATPTSPGPSARAIWRRSATLQSKLIDKAVALTRPGGIIVYCTCSLEPEEGEAQIAALLGAIPTCGACPIVPAEIGGLERMPQPGAANCAPCRAICRRPKPRLSGLDGFFAARLQRRP